MERATQLSDLTHEYGAFVEAVQGLTPEQFRSRLGDWTRRDIVAHLIGWNVNILEGCRAILVGKSPFYHYDGPNDYRIENARSIAQYSSTDREALLSQLAATLDTLVAYLEQVDPEDWERDTGVRHYRSGPATVSRCVDSLLRDYRNHSKEINPD